MGDSTRPKYIGYNIDYIVHLSNGIGVTSLELLATEHANDT